MSDDKTELPRGWKQVRLADIALLNPRLPVENLSDDFQVSFLPMRSVEAESGRFDPTAVRPYSEVKKGYTSFADGDVIFAKITPCMENGKVAVVQGLKNGIGFGSTEFHVVRPALPELSARLVFFHLIQERFRRGAKANMTGTAGQLRVPTSYLEDSRFPLPPLPEQRRIVAKIEELFSDLDAGVDALKKIQALLKRYRQSVLKAAFEGKLTAKWRKAYQGKLEPAFVLLERIQAERKKAGGKKFKELPPVDTTDLPELPVGWEWTSIGTCFDVRVGATPSRQKSEYWGGSIPWTSSGEIQFARSA